MNNSKLKKKITTMACIIVIGSILVFCRGESNTVQYDGEILEVFTKETIAELEEVGFLVNEKGVILGLVDKEATELIIPEGITAIDNYAFAGYEHLKEVVLSSTIEAIGIGAFAACHNIEEVEIADTISDIDQSTFLDTKWYKNQKQEFVIVGDGVLIKYNGEPVNLIIPDGVKHLNTTFEESETLESLLLPEGLLTIISRAFAACIYLNDIQIPDTLESVGTSVFYGSAWQNGSQGIFNIIGDGILIEYEAFDETVIIPENVKMIADAFSSNYNIVNVVIPDSVKKVDAYAFRRCLALKEVAIDTSKTWVHPEAFFETDIVIE